MSTSNGTSINEAAKKLSGMLSEQSQPTDTPQANTGEDQAETSTEQAETLTSDTETEPGRVKAKLGDIDVEFQILTEGVDADQFAKSLMMESDYRKKTMSLADERKAFEGEQGKLNEKINDLDSLLSLELEELNSDAGKELRETDPEEYLKRVDAAQKKHDKLSKFKAEKAEKEKSQKQKRISENVAKWSEFVPEWLDEGNMKKDLESAANMLTNMGFSQDELADFHDPRMMAVLKKATMFDAIKSGDAQKTRVKGAPKSATPAAKAEISATRQEFNKSIDKLKSSGKIKDAQEALKKMLK